MPSNAKNSDCYISASCWIYAMRATRLVWVLCVCVCVCRPENESKCTRYSQRTKCFAGQNMFRTFSWLRILIELKHKTNWAIGHGRAMLLVPRGYLAIHTRALRCVQWFGSAEVCFFCLVVCCFIRSSYTQKSVRAAHRNFCTKIEKLILWLVLDAI